MIKAPYQREDYAAIIARMFGVNQALNWRKMLLSNGNGIT
jgi:hypothetical protein